MDTKLTWMPSRLATDSINNSVIGYSQKIRSFVPACEFSIILAVMYRSFGDSLINSFSRSALDDGIGVLASSVNIWLKSVAATSPNCLASCGKTHPALAVAV